MRKFVMLVAMGMVCMPIGGIRSAGVQTDGTVAEAAPMDTADPLSAPWLVSPVRLVIVCVVLLLASWLNRQGRRQRLPEGPNA